MKNYYGKRVAVDRDSLKPNFTIKVICICLLVLFAKYLEAGVTFNRSISYLSEDGRIFGLHAVAFKDMDGDGDLCRESNHGNS
ncbi:MAG: hypothetical protein AAFO69_18555, partial [Bacteroidota bacterium]